MRKFCGVALDGKVVFGDLILDNDNVYIGRRKKREKVKPETVRELVNYDAEGNVLCEDDPLIGESSSLVPIENFPPFS